MLSSGTNILTCIHWWTSERILDQSGKISAPEETQISMHRTSVILPFMFKALDSLYIATRSIPSPWTKKGGARASLGGTHSLFINMPASPETYLLLRTVLSLTSDVYLSADSLLKIGNLLELESPVQQLSENANKFRDVRNFFTHLDEVLSNPDKHGITGATQTNCGIEYTDTAKGCVHLVLAGDKLHFSYRRRGTPNAKAMEVDIGKSAFNPMFKSARLIYAELISHRVHAQSCHHSPANNLYRV